MISYTYKSKEREEASIVFAHDCTEKDLGIRLYCPNPDCDAHMFLCNLNNSNIKPYFRATLKNHPHIKDCRYSKLNFKIENYDENKFDFEKATINVMKPSRVGQSSIEKKPSQKPTKKLPPHTIKQIYELAISNDINFEYNGTKMWQILADKRSAHIYHKGIFRKCMVEGYFAGYKTTKKYIRMKYFIDKLNFHYIRLDFYDDTVFLKAVDLFLEARPSAVVVWGEWKPIDYYFKTTIHSLNQIFVP